MTTYESIWTGAKGTGAPMQEATLCSDHRSEWSDEAEDLARGADDFSGYHWADSTESVARGEVSCIVCGWERGTLADEEAETRKKETK